MKLPDFGALNQLKDKLISMYHAMEETGEFDDCEDDEIYVSQEELEQLPVYLALRDSVREGMTLDEMIDAFADMCRLPVGDPDDLLFETGTYDFTGPKRFYFSLVRQFQYKSEDEYIQLHLDLLYTPSPATDRICDTEWGSLTDGDFFTMVRSCEAYQLIKDAPMAEVDIRIEET